MSAMTSKLQYLANEKQLSRRGVSDDIRLGNYPTPAVAKISKFK